jgi:hypothetical protein
MERAFFSSTAGREIVWLFEHKAPGMWVVMDEVGNPETYLDHEDAEEDYEARVREQVN